MIKLEEIEVNNYGHDERFPGRQKVMAFCVGGNEGVKAYFQHPENINWMVMADGDDGHWWVSGVISKYWVKGMIVALQKFQEEYIG